MQWPQKNIQIKMTIIQEYEKSYYSDDENYRANYDDNYYYQPTGTTVITTIMVMKTIKKYLMTIAIT